MNKLVVIILIILFLIPVFWIFSGVKINPYSNQTWGEKTININAIKIVNSTGDHYEYEGQNYYYIEGYIKNLNDIDAINIQIMATAYDENGTVVATNNTPYLEPKNVPSGGNSYFYFEFLDPENRIVRYELKITAAKHRY